MGLNMNDNSKKVNDDWTLPCEEQSIHNEYEEALVKMALHDYMKLTEEKPTQEQLDRLTFSQEFEETMEQQLKVWEKEDRKKKRKNSQPNKLIAKIAACIGFLLLVSIGTMTVSEAARIKIINYFMKQSDIASDFTFYNRTDEEVVRNNSETTFFANLVPKGFELTEEVINGALFILRYENDSRIFIEFTSINDATAISVDTEDALVSNININGVDVFVSEKIETVQAIYVKNENGISIISNMKKEEIIEIIKKYSKNLK